jgi:MFS-type transporter involved in bile tolerance (Atg22 family)
VRLATKNARRHNKNNVTKLIENAAFHFCALLRFLWQIPGCLVIELQQSTERSQGNLFTLSVASREASCGQRELAEVNCIDAPSR